jgi:gamma-butyrobetaine dioxygenase
VTWKDEHSSSFDFEWLSKRSFNRDNREDYSNLSYQPPKKFWAKNDFVEVFAKFDFNEILNSDEVFVSWLEHMATYGIALIENTPNTKNEVRKIAERVAFIKRTHYGDEFTVAKKKQTTAFAYTPSKLQLHVDVPYFDQMPGVNMLHCVTQSKSGGGNTLVDGFYVAELLQEKYPDYYQVLTRVSVNWSDYGEENGIKHQVILRAPVIW